MINDKWKKIEKYSENPLSHNVFFNVTKKTEKIVTAMYMVTSFLENADPIRESIRSSATKLLADVFSCVEASPVHRTKTLSQSIIAVEYLISLFEIARTMGFVSDMNTRILHKELMELQNTLHKELHTHEQLDTNHEPHVDIDQHSFLNKLFAEYEQLQPQIQNDIKDTQMSLINNVVNKTTYKRQDRPVRGESERRQEQILAIIQAKKSVTMKDIATRITNCTEKTLQRDLAALIEKGHIEKKGARRWSTYVLKG